MRALRRLGAVFWLAVQPLAWLMPASRAFNAMAPPLATIGFGAGSLWLASLANLLPDSAPGWLALIFGVLFVLITGAAYRLQTLQDQSPRLVVTRQPYTELMRLHPQPPHGSDGTNGAWYFRMEVANEPLELAPDAVAKRVMVRLSAFNEDRSEPFLLTASTGNEVFGRWMVEPNRAEDFVDLPPNGERFVIEFAERIRDYGPCYVASHLRAFEPNHAVPADRFWVRIQLRGTNCKQEFWVKVESEGQPRPECSLAPVGA